MRETEEILRLAGAGLVPCAAYLFAGLRLLPRLGVEATGIERLAWAWVFGTGFASLGIFLLRAVNIPVPLLAAGALAALAWPRAYGWTARADDAEPSSHPGWVRGVDAALGVTAALVFAAALGPETFWDGFEYHLPLVAAWTEGPLWSVPGMIDAELRAGIDLLYVPAVTSGFPDAAAAVSAGFALALSALVRAEAARRSSPGAGALAGFFTLLAPLVVEQAASTYVDIGVGVYGFAALLLVDRWNRGASTSALTCAALCLGFAVNAKLHAAALVPAAAVVALAGGRPPRLASLVRAAVVVAVVIFPWFARVTITTGNPLFPLFASQLGGGGFDSGAVWYRGERLLANYPAPRNPLGLLQYLVSLTFGRNVHVSGQLGALPLALAPFAAFARPSRASIALAATVAALALGQFWLMPAVRFGTPLWPWLAVAAAVGGQLLCRSGVAARSVVAVALGLLALHHIAGAGVRLLPRIPALRDPHAYERSVFPDQDNLRRMVAAAEPAVAIPMGAVSWMPKPIYNLLWERNGELWFGKGTPPRSALQLLRERGVGSLVIDVQPPHPEDGVSGHPIVDAWLETGHARIERRVEPLAARQGRRWILVELLPVDPEAP